MMGTSVKVVKYISAPATAAMRLAARELPPTRSATHDWGMSAL